MVDGREPYQTRYIEVPRESTEIRYAEPQPEIRYVEVPAQPVHREAVPAERSKEEAQQQHEVVAEKVGTYV